MKAPRYSKSKDVHQIVRGLVRRGWLFALTGGGHGSLTAPGGGCVTVAQSPGDHRAVMNIRADVRRLERPR